MNQFELFTMIFYVLDYYWDQNGGEELGMFLSDMSPFTFDAIGSANPAVYEEFCDFIKVDEIEVINSYELACKYVDWVNNLHVKTAFAWV